MSVRIFIDTNILVYLFSDTDIEKRDKIYRAVEKGLFLTGLNNINELANVLSRKYHRNYSEIELVVFSVNTRFKVVPFDSRTILSAVRIMERYRYSYFDSLVVATALENGCSTLYSEDMQHGQLIDGTLTFVDLFR